MPDLYTYTMTTDSMTENANVVKDALLTALAKEGLLKGTAEEVGSKYAVVMTKPGWWGRFINSVTGGKDSLHVRVVKLVD